MQDFTDEKIQCGRCKGVECICGIAGDPATDGLPLATVGRCAHHKTDWHTGGYCDECQDYIEANRKLEREGKQYVPPAWTCYCKDCEAAYKAGRPAPITPVIQNATPPAQPLFEQRAGRTISEATATFGERGTQYGDTWRNCQWLVLKASLRELGHKIPDEHLEAIASASFIDMKYQRHEGGYKRDHALDGINYTAYHADAMRELTGGNPS